MPEEVRVGMAREGTAGFTERAGFVVAVGINEPHALAEHVVRVLHFLERGEVVVMAVGVGHADAGRKAARTGRVEPGQGSARVTEIAVELGAQIIVDQTHAGIDVSAVTGRLAKVLTEDHGIVTAALLVKDGIAMIRIAEATGQVELALHAAEVARIAVVFIAPGHLSEKVIRHVLDRIEAKSIGFGAVHFPTSRADEVSADVFDISRAVGDDVGFGVLAELLGRGVHAQRSAGTIDQPAEIDHITVFIAVVLLGAVQVADEAVFGMRVAFVRSEIGIRRLVRDVDEVGETEVLHLPGAVPIAGVVPLAVEAVLGLLKMEIFRNHAGIKLGLPLAAGRGGFVEARDIESPVVHDVIEIDADAEAVRHFHHVQQFGLGAVAGAHGVALVFGTEIERIPQVITDGQPAGGLGRGRQPE